MITGKEREFYTLILNEIDTDIKAGHSAQLKENGGETDIDLLVRLQTMRSLNKIVSCFTKPLPAIKI